MDHALLEEIVRTDELREAAALAALYHGTATRFLDGIMREGLKPMERLYVHLSKDYDAAVKVGSRHGKPVVLRADAARMQEDDFQFYLSQNGVWLTKRVPCRYLCVIGA